MWRFRAVMTLWLTALVGLVTVLIVGVDLAHPAVAIPLITIVGLVFLILETE